MLKLPEASDKKGGDACAKKEKRKKKEPSRQKKETPSLSAVTSKVTTLKIFLAGGGRKGNKASPAKRSLVTLSSTCSKKDF